MNAKTNPDSPGMSALEKVAWTEALVSLAALILVSVLIPFTGHHAASAFAVLGIVILSFWFIRKRGHTVIIDERDLEIAQKARQQGSEAAWGFLVLALIAIQIVPWSTHEAVFNKTTLNWLIWAQFAIFVGVKGIVGITLYRRQHHAA